MTGLREIMKHEIGETFHWLWYC